MFDLTALLERAKRLEGLGASISELSNELLSESKSNGGTLRLPSSTADLIAASERSHRDEEAIGLPPNSRALCSVAAEALWNAWESQALWPLDLLTSFIRLAIGSRLWLGQPHTSPLEHTLRASLQSLGDGARSHSQAASDIAEQLSAGLLPLNLDVSIASSSSRFGAEGSEAHTAATTAVAGMLCKQLRRQEKALSEAASGASVSDAAASAPGSRLQMKRALEHKQSDVVTNARKLLAVLGDAAGIPAVRSAVVSKLLAFLLHPALAEDACALLSAVVKQALIAHADRGAPNSDSDFASSDVISDGTQQCEIDSLFAKLLELHPRATIAPLLVRCVAALAHTSVARTQQLISYCVTLLNAEAFAAGRLSCCYSDLSAALDDEIEPPVFYVSTKKKGKRKGKEHVTEEASVDEDSSSAKRSDYVRSSALNKPTLRYSYAAMLLRAALDVPLFLNTDLLRREREGYDNGEVQQLMASFLPSADATAGDRRTAAASLLVANLLSGSMERSLNLSTNAGETSAGTPVPGSAAVSATSSSAASAVGAPHLGLSSVSSGLAGASFPSVSPLIVKLSDKLFLPAVEATRPQLPVVRIEDYLPNEKGSAINSDTAAASNDKDARTSETRETTSGTTGVAAADNVLKSSSDLIASDILSAVAETSPESLPAETAGAAVDVSIMEAATVASSARVSTTELAVDSSSIAKEAADNSSNVGPAAVHAAESFVTVSASLLASAGVTVEQSSVAADNSDCNEDLSFEPLFSIKPRPTANAAPGSAALRPDVMFSLLVDALNCPLPPECATAEGRLLALVRSTSSSGSSAVDAPSDRHSPSPSPMQSSFTSAAAGPGRQQSSFAQAGAGGSGSGASFRPKDHWHSSSRYAQVPSAASSSSSASSAMGVGDSKSASLAASRAHQLLVRISTIDNSAADDGLGSGAAAIPLNAAVIIATLLARGYSAGEASVEPTNSASTDETASASAFSSASSSSPCTSAPATSRLDNDRRELATIRDAAFTSRILQLRRATIRLRFCSTLLRLRQQYDVVATQQAAQSIADRAPQEAAADHSTPSTISDGAGTASSAALEQAPLADVAPQPSASSISSSPPALSPRSAVSPPRTTSLSSGLLAAGGLHRLLTKPMFGSSLLPSSSLSGALSGGVSRLGAGLGARTSFGGFRGIGAGRLPGISLTGQKRPLELPPPGSTDGDSSILVEESSSLSESAGGGGDDSLFLQPAKKLRVAEPLSRNSVSHTSMSCRAHPPSAVASSSASSLSSPAASAAGVLLSPASSIDDATSRVEVSSHAATASSAASLEANTAVVEASWHHPPGPTFIFGPAASVLIAENEAASVQPLFHAAASSSLQAALRPLATSDRALLWAVCHTLSLSPLQLEAAAYPGSDAAAAVAAGYTSYERCPLLLEEVLEPQTGRRKKGKEEETAAASDVAAEAESEGITGDTVPAPSSNSGTEADVGLSAEAASATSRFSAYSDGLNDGATDDGDDDTAALLNTIAAGAHRMRKRRIGGQVEREGGEGDEAAEGETADDGAGPMQADDDDVGDASSDNGSDSSDSVDGEGSAGDIHIDRGTGTGCSSALEVVQAANSSAVMAAVATDYTSSIDATSAPLTSADATTISEVSSAVLPVRRTISETPLASSALAEAESDSAAASSTPSVRRSGRARKAVERDPEQFLDDRAFAAELRKLRPVVAYSQPSGRKREQNREEQRSSEEREAQMLAIAEAADFSTAPVDGADATTGEESAAASTDDAAGAIESVTAAKKKRRRSAKAPSSTDQPSEPAELSPKAAAEQAATAAALASMSRKQRLALRAALYRLQLAQWRLAKVDRAPYIRYIRLRHLRLQQQHTSVESSSAGALSLPAAEVAAASNTAVAPVLEVEASSTAVDAPAASYSVSPSGSLYTRLPRPPEAEHAGHCARLESVYYKHWALPFPHPNRPVPQPGGLLLRSPLLLLRLLAPQVAALLLAAITSLGCVPLPAAAVAAASSSMTGSSLRAEVIVTLLRRLCGQLQGARPAAEAAEASAPAPAGNGRAIVVLHAANELPLVCTQSRILVDVYY